jgi:mono/diheme cytochrome c family protein
VRRLSRHAVPLSTGLAAAVAAFVVVALTTDGGRERVPAAPGPAPAAPQTVSGGDGRAVFVRMGCGSCHRLAAAGSTAEMGPDLDQRLPFHTRESLTKQIVSPQVSGFGMPTDFGERMSDRELRALVDFLLDTRGR